DDVQNYLENALSPTQDGGTVSWTVELPWYDRLLALDMLERLHRFGEAKVRADLANMARRRITLLQAAIAAERDAFARNTLYDLLAQLLVLLAVVVPIFCMVLAACLLLLRAGRH
ncbi:MAG: hypothetical protein EBX37_02190, partial [Alphaproteobacteria bacterium]|nr:hypothetical protein [Alphaproteobacteria bacterium]